MLCFVELPRVLTHYYKGDAPFRSLSAIPDGPRLSAILDGLSEETALAFARFRSESYLGERRRIEALLAERFREKGGRPALEHPIYFVVGRSSWFERHEPKVCRRTLSLDRVAPDQVSFTYGDSMVSFAIAGGCWPQGDVQPSAYHGEVFVRSELASLVQRHGLPEERHATVPAQRFDYYLEAQVWDAAVLRESS
jgi:hypothetical protein